MVVFKAVTELGETTLDGVQAWEQVPQALYDAGFANSGKVRVHKLEYQLLVTTPHLIDTTHGKYPFNKGGE